jgi:hypothetical protein
VVSTNRQRPMAIDVMTTVELDQVILDVDAPLGTQPA